MPVPLEAALLERMAHYAVPGVALALIADSGIAAEAGYGVKEAAGRDPVTPATRFQACSISKPVAVLGMGEMLTGLTATLTDQERWNLAAREREAASEEALLARARELS